MNIYNQQDKRWATKTLGNTKQTIGKYGCLISDISMAETSFGRNSDPTRPAKKCRFTPEGFLMWDSLSSISLRLEKRINGRPSNSVVEAALAHPKQFCVLQVNKSHWVLATGKFAPGVFKIADSWFGDRATTKRYGNNITGAAIIALS